MRKGLPWVVAGLGTGLALVGPAVFLTSGVEARTVYTGGYFPLAAEDLDAYGSVLMLTTTARSAGPSHSSSDRRTARRRRSAGRRAAGAQRGRGLGSRPAMSPAT